MATSLQDLLNTPEGRDVAAKLGIKLPMPMYSTPENDAILAQQTALQPKPMMSTPQDAPVSTQIASSDDSSDDSDDDQPQVASKIASPSNLTRTPSSAASSDSPEQADSSKDTLNFGQANQDTAKALQDTRDRSNMAQLINGLGAAGETFGSALARAPSNASAQKAFSEQGKQAEAIPEDFQRQQALTEETDPNSRTSLALRGVLDKLGVKYTGEPSAAQLKVNLPYIFKDVEAQQAQSARAEDLKYKYDALSQMKQATNQAHLDKQAALNQQRSEATKNKMEKDDEAESGKILKEMNSMSASSRSALGMAATSKQKAQRLMSMLDDPSLTPQDYSAAATDMNAIIAGTATMGGAAHQEYNNLQSELTRAANYLSSGASPVEQPAIKQHMKDIAGKMVDLSNKVIEHNTRIVATGHPSYLKRHPEAFQKMADVINEDSTSASGQAASTGTQQVKVSNGKETRMIDPSDLEDAQTDGYQKVQ